MLTKPGRGARARRWLDGLLPRFPEPIPVDYYRQTGRLRIIANLVIFVLNLSAVPQLEKLGIDRDAFWRVMAMCMPLWSLDVAIGIAMWRRPFSERGMERLTIVGLLIEVVTFSLWLNVSGSVNSHMVAFTVLLVLTYRLALNFRIGVAALLSALVAHWLVVLLEVSGVVPPQVASAGQKDLVYGEPSRQISVMIMITGLYLVNFMLANWAVARMRHTERAAKLLRETFAAVAPERVGPHTGRTLAGRYALQERLGAGGMGEIYAARRLADNEVVAVKALHSHLVSNRVYLERFRREAMAAERIPHRLTARVFDVGIDTGLGIHFIVMEYLAGEDLETYLNRRGPLPPGELLPIAAQIAEAIDEAHAVNVIHRDLKPHNVFLVTADSGTAPKVKLLDFGISKILDSDEYTLTKTDAVIGTAAYMAPEQAKGQKDHIGPASDCYSLAAILYRALTGRLPYEASDLLVALRKIADGERPPEPSSIRPELNADVDAVLAVGMAHNMEDRYESGQALVADLERATRGILDTSARKRAGELGPASAFDETLANES